MTEQAQTNHELKQILLAIISDYDLWASFSDAEPQRDLPHSPYQIIEQLLTEGKLLLVVTNHIDDAEDRLNGLRQFYQLIAALYDYVVGELYRTFADKTLEFSYYEGHLCLVLVYSGPVPMVLEAIGRHVLPWMYQYYQQPQPRPVIMHDLAAKVLSVALGNPRDNAMRNDVIKRVLPLRLTYLQPVDPAELEPPSVDLPHFSDNGMVQHDEEETQPADSPQVNLRGSGDSGSKTAPLPGYFAGAGDE